MESQDKVAVINTVGLATLKDLLIKKGIFTRAEWTEAFDTKADSFEDLVRRTTKGNGR